MTSPTYCLTRHVIHLIGGTEDFACWFFDAELEARAKFEEQVQIFQGDESFEVRYIGVGIRLWAGHVNDKFGGEMISSSIRTAPTEET